MQQEIQKPKEVVVDTIYQTDPQTLTPTQLQSRLVYCDKMGAKQMRMTLQLKSPEAVDTLKEEMKQTEQIFEESSSSESDDEFRHLEQREQIEVGDKEIYILEEDYAVALKQISEKTNVKLILTASKAKIFSNSAKNIDNAIRELTSLTQRICVQLIEKFGNHIHQSTIYQKKLVPIKVMKWKLQYYFYFDKSKLKLDEALRRMKQATTIEHLMVYLMRRYKEDKQYVYFVRKVYAQYASEKLIKINNEAEKQEFKSEISKDGRCIILHSKDEHFIYEREKNYNSALNDEAIMFMIKLMPNLKPQEIAMIEAKITVAQKYLVYERFCKGNYTIFGFMIGKKNLKDILVNERFRGLFGRIFNVMFKVNEAAIQRAMTQKDKKVAMQILFFLCEASDKKKKYIENHLTNRFKLQGLATQIIHCIPKITEQGDSCAEMYLQAIERVLSYREQPQESGYGMANNTMNNTSIIDSQSVVNSTTILQRSVLEEVIVDRQQPPPRNIQRSSYNVWLDLKPNYTEMSEDKSYTIGKRNKPLAEKLQELTNVEYSVRQVLLNDKLKIDQVRPQAPKVTLVMYKNSILKASDCNLTKIMRGIAVEEGFLVEAQLHELVEHEKYFTTQDGGRYRPTHIIQKM